MIDSRIHRKPELGVTLFIAGVLALLGGLTILWYLPMLLRLDLDSTYDPPSAPRGFAYVPEDLLLGVFGLLLAVGGIGMFLRKKPARVLLGVGGVGIFALSIITIRVGNSVPVTFDFLRVSSLGVAFSSTLLVLTFLPSISRWSTSRLIRAERH
ncbi:hypothetical protein [Nocardia goodfellowii]|uniref:Uncharacterized protein n=1 Tax=Nocardia goodfellowii TaxID=882446 RepID=A0ABS4QP69_9NOCA|nr:hypothetical protein [Nocardia goodfellowii]MBP2193495.1 hypothetical protein [Nocardia goodfellowii]